MSLINRLDPSAHPVAAVCGTQVRIYGPTEQTKYGREVRKLMRTINFPTHGRALQYAQEHDDLKSIAPVTRSRE